MTEEERQFVAYFRRQYGPEIFALAFRTEDAKECPVCGKWFTRNPTMPMRWRRKIVCSRECGVKRQRAKLRKPNTRAYNRKIIPEQKEGPQDE